MATVLGDNTIEATSYGASVQAHLNKYVASASGTITQVFIYCLGNTGVATSLIMGIYDDVSGVPTNRLGLSNSTTLPNGQVAGWVECDVTSPVTIINGNTYWVAMADGGNGAAFAYGTTGGVGAGRGSTSTLPDPFGVPGWNNVGDHFSMYANIDPPAITYGPQFPRHIGPAALGFGK